jgi:ADP-ribosylglycohydrolase/Carbohydrate esterase 2 N-terminal
MNARWSGASAIPLLLLFPLSTPPPPERSISRAALEDKIRGGWAGQMIGVSFGAPTEFKSNGVRIEGELTWAAERIRNAIEQDDLYVEMTFAEVMDRIGLDATTEQYGEAFRTSKYALWHANASARKWLNRGVKAPLSGHPRYNLHANDIDFQIESDFIGLMTPGLPQEANRFCDRVGRVMNHGDGLYGGMFVTNMYAAAFFETDVRRIVEAGLAGIPADSGYGRIIRDVLDWSARHPDDWTKTWQLIQDTWDKDDPCPDGAHRPFNIDARLNGAYIAVGLLYGRGDFAKTVELTTRCGQDSDCNPSSAAGILGVVLGYSKIPSEWTAGIPAIAATKFEYTTYSFNDISRSTLDRALSVVKGAGGRVEGDRVVVPVQPPKAPPLEQWEIGAPDRVTAVTDAAWSWEGEWTDQLGGRDRKEVVGKRAARPGASASVTFTGTAVAVAGPHGQDGGRADMFLDGKQIAGLDAFIVERTSDTDLWHLEGLAPGEHTLRIVVRGDADPRSRGTQVTLARVITYKR